MTPGILRRTLLATTLTATLVTLNPIAAANPASTAAPAADEPSLQHYALILPENLPPLMQALKGRSRELGLSPEQTGSLAGIALEMRDRLQPLLNEARSLEKGIAAAALNGEAPAALADRLDRLQSLKRQAAEIQIDSTHRLRAGLTPAQYAQLVRIAESARVQSGVPERLRGSDAAALEQLRMLDNARYAESWAGAGEHFRKATAREDWARDAAAARRPLGALGGRRLKNLVYSTTLPGRPDGEYATFTYDSRFAEGAGAIETIVTVRESDGQWRLAGYFIK